MAKIVIDMMGGDNGISATKGGVRLFQKEHPEVELILVGDVTQLEEFKDTCTLVDAKEVLPMEVSVMEAMRAKNSSVNRAVYAYKEYNADGIISAGSTGGFFSLLTLVLKKMDGVQRPALITPFPTKVEGKYCVLLDVGASNENNAEQLLQFAKMGEAYYRVKFNKQDPNIYLISNGSEEGKGSPLYQEAYALLKGTENFKGYIEGRYAFNGDADVIVMDGFTGNVFLKTAEGMAKMMSGMIREAFTSSFSSKIGYLFAKKGFDGLSAKMDYKKVGGALLLGVNAVAVKAHGNSTEESFFYSMNLCYDLIKDDVLTKIKESLNGEE